MPGEMTLSTFNFTQIDSRDPNTIWIHRDHIVRKGGGVAEYESLVRSALRAGLNVNTVPVFGRWPWRRGSQRYYEGL